MQMKGKNIEPQKEMNPQQRHAIAQENKLVNTISKAMRDERRSMINGVDAELVKRKVIAP